MRKATAFAPATIANVAVGFDVLGFSFDLTGFLLLEAFLLLGFRGFTGV